MAYLEETLKARKTISINKTINEIESKGLDVKYPLPFYALRGCDTVERVCFLGKLRLFSVLKRNKEERLDFLFDLDERKFDENYKKCLKLISKCYSVKPCEIVNKLRYKYWIITIERAKSLCPLLEKLPPTDTSFREHGKRAMFQLNIWANADK